MRAALADSLKKLRQAHDRHLAETLSQEEIVVARLEALPQQAKPSPEAPPMDAIISAMAERLDALQRPSLPSPVRAQANLLGWIVEQMAAVQAIGLAGPYVQDYAKRRASGAAALQNRKAEDCTDIMHLFAPLLPLCDAGTRLILSDPLKVTALEPKKLTALLMERLALVTPISFEHIQKACEAHQAIIERYQPLHREVMKAFVTHNLYERHWSQKARKLRASCNQFLDCGTQILRSFVRKADASLMPIATMEDDQFLTSILRGDVPTAAPIDSRLRDVYCQRLKEPMPDHLHADIALLERSPEIKALLASVNGYRKSVQKIHAACVAEIESTDGQAIIASMQNDFVPPVRRAATAMREDQLLAYLADKDLIGFTKHGPSLGQEDWTGLNGLIARHLDKLGVAAQHLVEAANHFDKVQAEWDRAVLPKTIKGALAALDGDIELLETSLAHDGFQLWTLFRDERRLNPNSGIEVPDFDDSGSLMFAAQHYKRTAANRRNPTYGDLLPIFCERLARTIDGHRQHIDAYNHLMNASHDDPPSARFWSQSRHAKAKKEKSAAFNQLRAAILGLNQAALTVADGPAWLEKQGFAQLQRIYLRSSEDDRPLQMILRPVAVTKPPAPQTVAERPDKAPSQAAPVQSPDPARPAQASIPNTPRSRGNER
jgi:hypothetical protein